MKNTIIYLIGFPGTGKYTIAQELVAQTGARLVDNHLINNPIFSLLNRNEKLPGGIWGYTDKIRQVILEAIANLVPAEDSFIFTNALFAEQPEDVKVFHDILEISVLRNNLFVPVRLLCDLPELQRRIVSESRNARLKMTDAEGIKRSYEKHTILNPDHPHLLTLDVTCMTAANAAASILDHVQSLEA